MKKQTPKTSQDVITGLKIEGDHIPPKNRNIVNQDNKIDDEKDLDEQSHDETGDTSKDDEEKDIDDAVHYEKDEPYPEDSEQDIDDLLHKDNNYKGIY